MKKGGGVRRRVWKQNPPSFSPKCSGKGKLLSSLYIFLSSIFSKVHRVLTFKEIPRDKSSLEEAPGSTISSKRAEDNRPMSHQYSLKYKNKKRELQISVTPSKTLCPPANPNMHFGHHGEALLSSRRATLHPKFALCPPSLRRGGSVASGCFCLARP